MPVLARPDGTLIAGHGRLEAAIAEGVTKVPVIVARGWSEKQCRAYGIADNWLTENSEWDEALLKLELGEIDAEGYESWRRESISSNAVCRRPLRTAAAAR
jgi:ParB-like chromosome segregation protein Spo0J